MNHSENKAVREPFVRIAKRNSIYWTKAVMIRVLAIIAALIVDALIIYFVTKLNPIKVYVTMFEGAFGTKRRVWITVREIMMLLCIAVGLAPAFKMRFWNVGAEGQILVGGIATAACMIYLNSLPTPLLLLVMFIASAIAGAIWGLIPAIFKAKWDTNETLFTLMMNYLHGGPVGEPLRLQQRGRDQPEYPGRLVPEALRPDLHAQRDPGHGAHRRHVLLPQAQQAGL